jgi:NitT/TauT family transport system ATP-binding protein
MKISVRDLSFGFGSRLLFDHLCFEFSGADSDLPLVILGPSGCGKTSLLRLIAGLLHPCSGAVEKDSASVAFVFQEPRLLPWLTVLENIRLPLEKIYGPRDAEKRAATFLESVSLRDKAASFPSRLSGGQRQRAAIARAFAFPAEILLMDEPFHSLDIPLRLDLMNLTLELLGAEKRLALAITHDPREAVFLGGRIIVLGRPPEGIIFDEKLSLSREERSYGSPVAAAMEKKLIGILGRISG